MKKIVTIIAMMFVLTGMVFAAEWRLRDDSNTKIVKYTPNQTINETFYKLFVNYMAYGTQEDDLKVQVIHKAENEKELGFLVEAHKEGRVTRVEIYPDAAERKILLMKFDKEFNKVKEQVHERWGK